MHILPILLVQASLHATVPLPPSGSVPTPPGPAFKIPNKVLVEPGGLAAGEVSHGGKPDEFTRESGPHHSYPDYGCTMCLGHHLQGRVNDRKGRHSVSKEELERWTWRRWTILHDNLHNSEKTEYTIPPTTTKSQDTTEKRLPVSGRRRPIRRFVKSLFGR